MATVVGLIFIVVAWLFQMLAILGKSNKIQVSFVITYIIGAVLLIADAQRKGMMDVAGLNLLSLLAALVVFFKLKK